MSRRPLHDDERVFLRQLGDTIRVIRREQNLLQEQLGARSGVSGSRIGEIERGIVDTSVSRIAAIAAALGLSPSALFRRKELLTQDERATDETKARATQALRRLPARDVEIVGEVIAALGRRG